MSKELISVYKILSRKYNIPHTKGNIHYFPYSKLRYKYKHEEYELGKRHSIYFTKIDGGNFQKHRSHRKCLQITIYNKPLYCGGDCILNIIIPVESMFYI